MQRGVRLFAAVGAGAVLALAGCSSSSNDATAPKAVAVQPKAAPVTTTTQPTAIGLRTNADERAEFGPDKPLTDAQREQLGAQLVVARETAMKFPTVADATKAGFILAGQFTPGAGAHYVAIGDASKSFLGNGGSTTINPATPLAYIYEGTSPTSRITGLMYASFTVLPPDGFVGPNDHWHRHTNLCITFQNGQIGIPFPPDQNVQKSACDKLHGQFLRETMWMLHAWVVPGWESPEGVFSHANIDLHCADGTDHTDQTGFCRGAA
jgi:hypothetical protein